MCNTDWSHALPLNLLHGEGWIDYLHELIHNDQIEAGIPEHWLIHWRGMVDPINPWCLYGTVIVEDGITEEIYLDDECIINCCETPVDEVFPYVAKWIVTVVNQRLNSSTG